ncbi:hypothetical protein CFC21_047050 [Triticum aestivum]|uniref:Uncharacterized protein n=2 Tax=Triticum aestivum TaxID=4565 RepID=A0A3B6GRQ0_WHEAT|nr:hypothetical protein CFC21_047050 [Triticum aestivum]
MYRLPFADVCKRRCRGTRKRKQAKINHPPPVDAVLEDAIHSAALRCTAGRPRRRRGMDLSSSQIRFLLPAIGGDKYTQAAHTVLDLLDGAAESSTREVGKRRLFSEQSTGLDDLQALAGQKAALVMRANTPLEMHASNTYTRLCSRNLV